MFPAIFFDAPGGGSFALGLTVTLLLAAAIAVGSRRDWPLALRRALLFLLLTSLLDLGSSLLPDPSRNAALPGLKVAGWILALVALAEFCQYLLLDLALVVWLRRPPPLWILRDLATLVPGQIYSGDTCHSSSIPAAACGAGSCG